MWPVLFLCIAGVSAITRDQFYPYGHGVDQRLPRGASVASPEIPLNVPIVFYGETYETIYVNNYGILSFRADIPSFLNAEFPLPYPSIAAFYSNVDTTESGEVYYRETNESHVLSKAEDSVQSNFHEHYDFKPTSVFVATWVDVTYSSQQWQDRKNSFQIAVISNGTESFVEFLYPEREIQWIQRDTQPNSLPDAKAQAGFIADDGRLFALRGSGSHQIRNVVSRTNTHEPGKYVFRVGNFPLDGTIDVPDQYDENEVENEEETKTCAQSGPSVCHLQAKCVDYQAGICCQCNEGFYGNGKSCIKDDVPLRVRGKLNGILNNKNLNDVDIQAYVVVAEGRSYTALSQAPISLGSSLQLLNTLGGAIGWLFAKPSGLALNGYQLTGGVFNYTADVYFTETNERVFINQEFIGHDVFDQLTLDADIRGTIPEVPTRSKLEVTEYDEQYTIAERGLIHSISRRTFTDKITGKKYEQSVSQTFTFNSCKYAPVSEEDSTPSTLKVIKNYLGYENKDNIVRYGSSNKIKPTGQEDPCVVGRSSCGPHSTCVVVGDSFTCVCQSGFTSIYYEDKSVCVDIDECAAATHNCDVNAYCYNQDGGFQCRCHEGYEGDGVSCKTISRCRDKLCDPNAQCVDNPSEEAFCLCRAGFTGDGQRCWRAVETSCNCSPYGHCTYSEEINAYRCECNPGFIGDGIYCSEEITAQRQLEQSHEQGEVQESVVREQPGQDSREVPDETPNLNPYQEQEQAPSPDEAPNQYPYQVPEQAPNQYPYQVPEHDSSQYPYQVPERPNQYPYPVPEPSNEYPYQTPEQEPSQYPHQASEQESNQYPYPAPSQYPYPAPEPAPSQYPYPVPEPTNQYPYQAPEQAPSQYPYQAPEPAPSQYPYPVPEPTNQYPYQAPSQYPYQAPEPAPSQYPYPVPEQVPQPESDQRETEYEVTAATLASTTPFITEADYNDTFVLPHCDNNGCVCPPGYSITKYENNDLCRFDSSKDPETESSNETSITCYADTDCPPNAICLLPAEAYLTNHPTLGQCVCPEGYEGDAYECIERTVASCLSCGRNAHCIPTAAEELICVCDAGYHGDGYVCRPNFSCTNNSDCEYNAECRPDPQSNEYVCQCVDGYTKDQNDACIPGQLCDGAVCAEHASCQYNEALQVNYCQCDEGFEGEGISKCVPAGKTCDVAHDCSPNAICSPTETLYQCVCREGFVGDGYTCDPEVNCKTNIYLCDVHASCLKTNDGYGCECNTGYNGNGSHCELNPRQAGNFLVASDGASVYRVPFQVTPRDFATPFNSAIYQIAVGIDVDCLTGKIYWGDVGSGAIKRASYDGSDFEQFISFGVLSPEGLAVDWAARNMFWTDSKKLTIEVANLDTKVRKVLFQREGISNPRGIAVHPGKGKIFWTDWNRAEPKIEWANMDGSQRGVFLDKTEVKLPNSLAIDWSRDRLCYSDAGTYSIRCVSIDTLQSETIAANCSYPFGLAISGDTFYWTDWKTLKIEYVNKFTEVKGQVPIATASRRLYGVTVAPESCPAQSNICQYRNGQCESDQICLPDGQGGRTCVTGDTSY